MVSLKFIILLFFYYFYGKYVLAEQLFKPDSDPNLVEIVNKPNFIGGKYEITSINPLGEGGFGFILPGSFSSVIK